MPLYSITAPDGNDYQIEGPEGATKEQIISAVQSKLRKQSVAEGLALQYKSDPGMLENFGKGVGQGAVGMLESAALGAGTLLDEDKELALREQVKRAAAALSPTGADPESIANMLGQGVGSVAAALPTAALGPAAIPAAAALFVGAGAGEASERAREAGATQEERDLASAKGAAIGSLDILPFGRFAKALRLPLFGDMVEKLGPETVRGIRNRIHSAALSGGIEAAQESATNILQNLNEQGYNPEQTVFEGLGQAAGVGGGTGALVQGMVDLFVGRRGRGAQNNQPDPEDEQVDKTVEETLGLGYQPFTPVGLPDGSVAMTPEDLAAYEAKKAEAEAFNNSVEGRKKRIDEYNTRQEELRKVEEAQKLLGDEQLDAFPVELVNALEQPAPDVNMEDTMSDADRFAMVQALKRQQAQREGTQEEVPQEQLTIDQQIAAAQAQEAQQRAVNRQEGFARQRQIEQAAADEAELTRMQAEEDRAAQQRADLERESAIESLGAAQADKQAAQTEQARDAVLQSVVANNKSQNLFAVLRDYSDALKKSKFGQPEPTNEEVARIQRAINIQFAEPEAQVQQEIPSPTTPEGSPTAEIEAAIPEKTQATTQQEQMSFPGMGKQKAPPVQEMQEEQAAPRIVDYDLMNQLSVAKAAPIRKRVEGLDLNDPAQFETVKSELITYANNPKAPQSAKFNITKFLEGESANQIEAFGPRGNVLAPTKAATNGRRVKPVTESKPTEPAAEQRGRGVGTESAVPDTTTTTADNIAAKDTKVTAKSTTGAVGTTPVNTVPAGTAEDVKQDTLEQPPKTKQEQTNVKPTTSAKATTPARAEKVQPMRENKAASVGTAEKKPVKAKAETKTTKATDNLTKKNQEKREANKPSAEATKEHVDAVIKGAKENGIAAAMVGKDWAYTSESPTDPSTAFDFLQLKSLFKTKGKYSSKAATPEDAAKVYFGRNSRPIDAIIEIAYDIVNKTPNYTRPRQDALRKGSAEPVTEQAYNYFKGSGFDAAKKADQWVRENLSDDLIAQLDKKLEQKLNERDKAESAFNTTLTANQLEKKAKKEAEKAVKLAKLVKKKTKARENLTDDMRPGEVRTFTEEEREDYLFDEDNRDLMRELGLFEYSPDAPVADLANPMHPAAIGAINKRQLRMALNIIAGTTNNPLIKRFASRIADKIGDTKIELVDGLRTKSGKLAFGVYDQKTDTIKLNTHIGVTPHTLLHEASHATLHATLNNKSHPLTKKITKLYNEVKDQLGTAYGAKDIHEFASEAMGNEKFQQELASLYAGKDSDVPAWRQFVNAVVNFLKGLAGFNTEAKGKYAQLNDFLEAIIAPAPELRGNGEMHMLSMEGKLNEIADKIGAAYGNRNNGELKDLSGNQFGDGVRTLFSRKIPKVTKQGFLSLMHSFALGDISRSYGFGELGKQMHDLFNKEDADLHKGSLMLDGTQKSLAEFLNNASEEKQTAFHALVHDSTRYKTNPFKPRSEYKGYKDKLEYWDDPNTREQVKLIGADGAKMYEQLRKSYADQYDKLKETIYKRIASVTSDSPTRYKLQKEIFEKLFAEHEIDPFFPLARKGDYGLAYKVDLGEGEPETVVERYDNYYARERAVAQLQDAVDSGMIVEGSMKPFFSGDNVNYENAPPAGFIADAMDLFEAKGVDKDTQEMFARMYVNLLPQTSYAKGLLARKGTLGYIEDAHVAFKERAYALNHQINRIESSERIGAKMREIERKAEELGSDGEDSIAAIAREWKLRAKFAISPPNDAMANFARNANRMAFVGTIGFNLSSAAVNLTQVPMVVFPFLAGKTNPKVAAKALYAANRLFMGAGVEHTIPMSGANGETIKVKSFAPSIDNYWVADDKGQLKLRDDLDLNDTTDFYNGMTKRELLESMTPLVQAMQDNSQLNRTLFYDSLGAEMSGKQKTAMDALSAWSAFPFHIAERSNRQVAIVASYLNEMERLKTKPMEKQGEKGLSDAEKQEKAIDNALHIAQMTNGGSHLSTAPRLAQHGLGRIAMMYKSFGINMYYMQFVTAKKMLQDADPEVRKEAFRQLAYMHGTVTAMAGVSGLTMYGLLAAIANMFLDDDEEDFETLTRKYIGEGWYKGGINQMTKILGGEGVDVSSRIGLSNLIIASNRYNFDPSMEKSIVQTLGGPAYGYASQVARGVGDMMAGEIQRGVENVLPSAFRNAAKATFRYSQEGALTRRGDPIMGELTPGLLAAQALGFAPAEYTRNQEQNQIYKKIDKEVNLRRTKLLKRRYIALRMGDTYELAQTMEDIREFNERHPANRIDAEAIKNSQAKHMKTTQRMINGVLYSPKTEKEVREAMAEWY